MAEALLNRGDRLRVALGGSGTLMSKAGIATTTAGLRATYWSDDALPAGVALSVHPLKTEDGATVTGFLFRKGSERTVVASMHPREMVVPSYLVPEVLKGGAAMWIMGSRSPGNDLRLEHETALLDLAAGQVFLREVVGYENVVLQGTSGGGPLAAFYIQQAGHSPDARIARTPSGRPVPMGRAIMPMPDGVVFISAHLGQGMLMLDSIDPAVTDEADPLQTEQALSAFAAENGFRPPPETARYTPAFLAAYRVAQRRRVERIDAAAHALLARKAEGRRRAKDSFSAADAILAAYTPIFQVWRTDADPRCFDLSLDPSDRAYGSLWGGNPMASNYGSVGFGRVCTPESWLSNWSGLSSNAATLACVPRVGCPVLMIEYTGDNSVFPADAERIWQAIGSTRKTRHRVHGNHHGQRVDPAQPLGQAVAGQHIRDWLEAHRLV